MTFVQIVILLVVILLVIDLGMRIYFGRKALDLLEKMPPFHVEVTPPQKQAVPFQVETKDGLMLRGSIYHPDDMPPLGIVVFCPETIASHWSAVKYCQGLIESGFIVVSFDFRNQGESDSLPSYQPLHWVTEYEVEDLETVLDWVQDQEAFRSLPVGVMGISRGGATALMTLPRRKDIQLFCCDSAYTNDQLISHFLERYAPIVLPRFVMKFSTRFMWHIKKTLYVAVWLRGLRRGCHYLNSSSPFSGTSDRRVLLISGSGDSYVPTRIARKLEKMLGDQCQEVWVVPKASHNGARSKNPEQYDAKVAAFFRQMPVPAEVSELSKVRQSEPLRSTGSVTVDSGS